MNLILKDGKILTIKNIDFEKIQIQIEKTLLYNGYTRQDLLKMEVI